MAWTSFSIFFLLTLLVQAAPTASQRPDILLLMPDQMRGDCLSILKHPVVRTPQMDKLAREGTLFLRAYSTIPSCIPARRSLLTGLFPATSRIVGYAARPIQHPTLPQVLSTNGYTAVLVGRNMHQVPKEELYGYQREITGSTYVSGDDYDSFLTNAVPDAGGIRKVINSLELTSNGWKAAPWPLDEKLHPTSWITCQSRKVLAEASLDRPIFLTASFYAPHPPLFPPRRLFDAYYSKKLPAAARGDWVDWEALSPEGDKQGHRVFLQGEDLRRTQAGYFGLIQHLDEQFGLLIADFKKRSEKAGRPWMIILTSDHGEMLGDHGYFRKCEPYEGSARIPMIIAGSSELKFKKGLRPTGPVCLEDIMPTLLDLANAPVPKPMDGASLVPVLRGQQKQVREVLHLEHAPCYSQEQAFQAMIDGRFKYIWRPLDGTEHLFDLAKDPHEEHDLAKTQAQSNLLQQWRERMMQQLANRPEGFTDGIDLIAGRPYKPVQGK